MSLLQEHRTTMLLHIKSLTLSVGDGMQLTSGLQGATVWVIYMAHGPVRGDDEMPAEEADIEIMEITLVSPVWLSNGQGITVSLDARANLLEVLTDSQMSVLEGFILDNPDTGSIGHVGVVL